MVMPCGSGYTTMRVARSCVGTGGVGAAASGTTAGMRVGVLHGIDDRIGGRGDCAG